MDTAIANARVPRAKKEASLGLLQSLGLTTSDLINGAYDYLLSTGTIPTAGKESLAEGARDWSTFASFVVETTLDIDWGEDFDGDYKRILREGKIADYESLS